MPPRRRRGPLQWLFSLWGFFLLGLLVLTFFSEEGSPRKAEWAQVEELIVEGSVEKIEVVNDKTAHIFLTKEAIDKYSQMPTYSSLPTTGHQ